LWGFHFPGEKFTAATQTLCVLEKREVIAAAQYLLPKDETSMLTLLWIVAQPGHPIPLRTLLHLIDRQADARGCGGITFSRFSFGVGWFGIPAGWTHVIEAMMEMGYKKEQPWLLMCGDTSTPVAVTKVEGLRYHWNMNKPALEWELTAYDGETLAGECDVWGIPLHAEDCHNVSEWVTVELVEVAKPYRRRGIGKWLLAEQMRFHARRGVKHFMLWTGQRNKAARKLNEKLGFTNVDKLIVLEKPPVIQPRLF
jgi:GNAT superfamily N-acetyltransferase